jgi:hypothetical protein
VGRAAMVGGRPDHAGSRQRAATTTQTSRRRRNSVVQVAIPVPRRSRLAFRLLSTIKPGAETISGLRRLLSGWEAPR